MNGGRKNCSLTTEENCEQSEPLRTQSKLKINRLKRSPKTNPTQKPDITNSRAEADFKTPTRVPKLGFRSSVSDESPNNDFELQHEIIWDPTSPATPVRNGRGRRRTAAFKSVDISDIVNRIAPKNKRPEEADSTLLQWIGDTAVPCTPEIRESRTKPKPPRQNPVDDLLKLAKQFDFNMFQQEEAHLRPGSQSSAEAMHEVQDLFFNDDDPPASPQFYSKAETPPLGLKDTKTNSDYPPGDLGVIEEIEDDLDLLFEGSTQQLSGGLSLGFSARSQSAVTVTPQSGAKSDSVKKACGFTRVGRVSQPSTASVRAVATTFNATKQVGGADDFDDDWNSDDLLDNSLVMEMTQNPELFATPQCSSTQKQMNKNNVYYQNDGKGANSGRVQRFDQRPESIRCGPHWNTATGNENSMQKGFNLKSNTETKTFPHCKVPIMVPCSHSISKTSTPPKKLTENQQDFVANANATLSPSLASRLDASKSTLETKSLIILSLVTKEKKNLRAVEDDVLCDFAAEDLDSIFASDDIWDDGTDDDDDDLFCEACEKVEESMAEPQPHSKAFVTKPTPQSSCVQSTENGTSKRGRGFIYERSTPANQAPSSTNVLPGAHCNSTLASAKSMMTPSERIYRFSHDKSATGTGSAANNAARQVSESATATAGQLNQRNKIGRHPLKMPHGTFNAALSVSKDAVTRCSDAEIEQKKQQAMERRRRRLLADPNLRAPI